MSGRCLLRSIFTRGLFENDEVPVVDSWLCEGDVVADCEDADGDLLAFEGGWRGAPVEDTARKRCMI